MDFPEVDQFGELVCVRSGSSYGALLRPVPPGHALLIVQPPVEPAWWDGDALDWVIKPPPPSDKHTWDPGARQWIDPRTPDEARDAALAALRSRRDAALSASDVMALRALEALLPPALQAYRKALRDLPATAVDPVHGVDWPARPVL